MYTLTALAARMARRAARGARLSRLLACSALLHLGAALEQAADEVSPLSDLANFTSSLKAPYKAPGHIISCKITMSCLSWGALQGAQKELVKFASPTWLVASILNIFIPVSAKITTIAIKSYT